ncbi:MAG: c-type cytochrome [bacterium]|nr:c-type cytochrome [bacterium]
MKLILLIVYHFTFFTWSFAVDAKTLYATCAACHGANGEGVPAMQGPALAGQSVWYLKRQIKSFQKGHRGGAGDTWGMTMRAMASILATDEQLDAVAKYISQMKPSHHESTLAGDATQGKSLYMVCTACHGADGKGLKALNSPSLIFQHDWYLARQLNNYKNNIRGVHKDDIYGAQMRPMASTLTTTAAMNNVLAYINQLSKTASNNLSK